MIWPIRSPDRLDSTHGIPWYHLRWTLGFTRYLRLRNLGNLRNLSCLLGNKLHTTHGVSKCIDMWLTVKSSGGTYLRAQP